MNLLARLDPGDSVTGLLLVVVLQTSVVTLLAALLGRVVFRRRADARHVIWLGALILILISPAAAVVASRLGVSLWVITLPTTGHGATPAAGDTGPRPMRPRPEATVLTVELPVQSGGAETVPPDEVIGVMPDEQANLEASRAVRPELDRGGNPLTGGLTLLWAVVALASLGRTVVGWRQLAALARSARMLDPVRHGATLDRVRNVFGIASLPSVVTSTRVRGPVAVGMWRPCVVLPEGLAESIASDSLRDVLVHECAHIIRRDAWVGLLQRLAGALFWPHPLIHFANGQLTRAREEICDNYVLRCSDARRYARTLLALTEQCMPVGAMRPGLGLLGTRWTLTERVAGLLDSRRIPMTRTTNHVKIAVAIVLAPTALIVASLRFDHPAHAVESMANQIDPKAAAPAIPNNAVWSVDGIVVDEQDRPVGEAVVHAREEADPAGAKTAADGKFTLWVGHGRMYTSEIVAEIGGGARIGRVQFIPARQYAAKAPVRVVMKPAASVKVRVNDAAGRPIAGAAVEAFDYAYQFHSTTGADGVAILRVPADARIPGVIGLKSGAGFDYFENYRTNPPYPEFAFPPLPQVITLTLDGARTVRVKAVDPAGQPVSGVVVKPFRPQKAGKIETINIAPGATTRTSTDEKGIAVFDWLPKGAIDGKESGAVTLFIEGPTGFIGGMLRYVPTGADELTSKLERAARLTGTVRYLDGSLARGALVIAGLPAGDRMPTGTRTDTNGRYVFESIPPGVSHVIVVSDENWASPSLISDVMKEGQEQGGLDFTLTKGTVVHGRITDGPDGRPAAGVGVDLREDKGPLPKELRTVSAGRYRASRTTYTDAHGHYQLRVGPGRYSLATQGVDPDQAIVIDVRGEPEIIRDFVANERARKPEKFIKGVVVETTPTGDRPVAGAWAFRWPVVGVHKTDGEGRFMVEQLSDETTLYAYAPDKGLAGFATIPPNMDTARVVVSRTGTIRGRVVSSDGNPRAKQRLRVQVARGTYASSPRFAVSAVVTDEEGRFTYQDAPVGSTGEIEAFHEATKSTSVGFGNRGPRTVVSFEVRDVDPIQLPDIVVPAEKPAMPPR
jgi:beta-lactamase regulating signal transducer with metallopeptidase domain/protocatechuate 3,4-dioxygenase beta subunit